MHLDQQNWSEAEGLFREAAEIAIRRARRGSRTTDRDETLQSRAEIARASASFAALIKTVHRLAAIDPARAAKLGREMFETAQWAQSSEAASAVAKMAARSANEPALASMIRERQDLAREWHARDRLLLTALARSHPLRVPAAEEQHRARMSAIDGRLAEIDKMIAGDHQQFAAVESLEPLSVAEVQDLIGQDEILVMFFDTQEAGPLPEETFLWVVTKATARWLRIDLGTRALIDRITALRCGLDRAAWRGHGAAVCAKSLNLTPQRDPAKQGRLPFNLEAAFEFYRGLFNGAEDLIKGKHLLIVPSGPLMHLPFPALVTEAPFLDQTEPDEAYRSASWLGHRQPLSVLPAVSSLKALRQHARESRAGKPFVGFGNPLLLGDPENGEDKAAAELAAKTVKCAATFDVSASLGVSRTGSRRPPSLRAAAPADLRRQAPLPETADELCTVATSLGASEADVYLGPRATETAIKAASERGDLARYRIVHFATHAALAGQVAGAGEPGLILTPPDKASTEDDGYLSASEIAGLKLDADWVILSACSTAAGDERNAKAFSGLTRAFFYAQARAVLASHWEVDSSATVKLVTTALNEVAADNTLGRAEALRRSMVAMSNGNAPHEAHPAYWAPFVLVGEGSRR